MVIDSGMIETLRHCYQYDEDIADDDLVDEAIETLEQVLLQKDGYTLYHRSRPEVLAYLALLQVKN